MKLFVTTLALAAAVSNGANLRSSLETNEAMKEFMAIYGDEVSVAKEFKHDPQKVLKKFIVEQKARTMKEHQETIEGGREKCTTDHKAKVTLNDFFGSSVPRLEGCMPTSTCAKDSNRLADKREDERRCVEKYKRAMGGKTKSLAEETENLAEVLRAEKATVADRKAQRERYEKFAGENKEAMSLLGKVQSSLEGGADIPALLETGKEALSRHGEYTALLEAAGSGRTERLLKLVREFTTAIRDHTKQLDGAEAKEAANHAKMMTSYAAQKSDSHAMVSAAKDSKSEVWAKYKECNTKLTATKQDFDDVFEHCKLHQEKFSQSAHDNLHIMDIMKQVYKLIHHRLGWNTPAGPSAATAATGSATGPSATGASSTGGAGATAAAASTTTGATGSHAAALGATRL